MTAIRKCAVAAAAFFGLVGAAPALQAPLKMWRMDCGTAELADLDLFSDTGGYGRPGVLTVSCYLLRHGDQYMIWDTGFGVELTGPPRPVVPGIRAGIGPTLVAQLGQLGVRPEQISIVGISHNHGDHLGQAVSFPKAKLLIGAKDWEQLMHKPTGPGLEPQRLKPWIDGAPKELVEGDKDVFGDGSVVMLTMPGHTPGHHSLLVRLKNRGPVLLTGDLYHFTEQRERGRMPPFNYNRADTLASFDRFEAIAKNLKATVIIQHERADVAKLPAFPEGAD